MRLTYKVSKNTVREHAERYSREKQELFKKAVLETALVDVETQAKQNLTRAGHVDTGRLRASVHTASRYRGKSSHSYRAKGYSTKYRKRVRKTSFDGTLSVRPKDDYEAIVGSNVIYARYIHRITPYLSATKSKAQINLNKRLREAIGGR